jgi:hypothetical protein
MQGVPSQTGGKVRLRRIALNEGKRPTFGKLKLVQGARLSQRAATALLYVGCSHAYST